MTRSCKDCPDRYVGCHAQCPDYKAMVERNRKIQEARHKRVEEESFYRAVRYNNKPKGRWK